MTDNLMISKTHVPYLHKQIDFSLPSVGFLPIRKFPSETV